MDKMYQAHDARLKRDVALKTLPDACARDPERVARFQREAEAPATLTYPNIGIIDDLQDDAGTRFLVLEREGSASMLTMSPTLSVHGTLAGVILGTAA